MPRYLVEIIACGVSRLNAKRQRLKELSAEIDERFRQCNLVTYRQIALEKGSVWDLIAERNLPEMMSAWTLSPAIAKTFKGGVPPEGWQGVIVALKPPAGSIILNLDTLYRSDDFLIALDRERGFITGCADGAGRYGGTQSEVVLEIDSLNSSDIYALGGYSADRDTLIRIMFHSNPTPELIAWFDHHSKTAGVAPGPMWLEGDPLVRVMKRMQPHIERLKPIKAAEMAAGGIVPIRT
ncbi:hypothetical protein [Mycoplana sp. MJR14]|uniref:hypothetical protein n=1 Tax=Mycoplana sp. MJR14 TaxID=3032583 RepID=UPI000AAC40D3|nr:hypothetical protein [Mycoplana sp. MJR14]MDF1632860.1 hypothetical protein [Mycoplana sp. MJR14]